MGATRPLLTNCIQNEEYGNAVFLLRFGGGMAAQSEGEGKAARRPAGEGVKGAAAREVRQRHGGSPTSAETVRKALQRVGSATGKASSSEAPRRRRSHTEPQGGSADERILQALLGRLAAEETGDEPADTPQLGQKLSSLSDAELERLSRLLAAVQAARAERGGGRQPLLDRLNDRLAAAGVTMDVNCKTTIINIGGDRADGDGRPKARSFGRSNWGRYLGGKLKDFLEGR